MRTNPFLLITLLLAGQAAANLIPLSGFRSVSISGSAQDIDGNGATSSYSQTQSLSGFGTFNASLSDSTEQGRAHAESRASQTSAITANEISLSSIVWASEGLTNHTEPFGQTSGAVSSAHSTFEITFNVLEPLIYELDASRSIYRHRWGIFELDFLLGSASHGTILNDLPVEALYFGGFSGILLPDIYTLRFNADMVAFADPLGDTEGADYGMNFHVSPVPDAGSTMALLGTALCAIGGICRKLNLA
jgi:hypothetical protein